MYQLDLQVSSINFVYNCNFIFKTIVFRKCKCFKRDRESDDEDLSLSTQFQQFLDDLSSDEESVNSIQDVSLSSNSENNLSDFDETFEIFNEIV